MEGWMCHVSCFKSTTPDCTLNWEIVHLALVLFPRDWHTDICSEMSCMRYALCLHLSHIHLTAWGETVTRALANQLKLSQNNMGDSQIMSLSIIKACRILHLLCSSKAEQSECMLLDGWMLWTTWFWWSGWSEDAIFSELLAKRLRTLTLQRCSITIVWTSDMKVESFALIGSFELFVSKNEPYLKEKWIRAQSAFVNRFNRFI